MCMQLEQEIEAERKREQVEVEKSSSERKSSKKGFKGLVTACERKTQILTTDVHVTCFIYWSMIMSLASSCRERKKERGRLPFLLLTYTRKI